MNEFKYYLKDISFPAQDVAVLELGEISGKPVFDFLPGQYVMISYRDEKGKLQEKHTFSIASSPTEKFSLRLGIRIMGKFTQGLKSLKPGQEIFVSGPFGKFVFDKEKHSDIVFVAGGVGVTPFLSSLCFASKNKLSNKMTLFYAARTFEGAVFREEILDICKNNQNIKVLIALSEQKDFAENENFVLGRLDSEILQKRLGSVKGKTFFLCGPVPFMDAMKENLAKIGVSKEQIQTEEFSMIPDDSFWIKFRNLAYSVGVLATIFALVFLVVRFFSNKNSNASSSSQGLQTTSTQDTGAAGYAASQANSTVKTVQPATKTRVS